MVLLSPRCRDDRIGQVVVYGKELVANATLTAARTWRDWRQSTVDERAAPMKRLAARIEAEVEGLARHIALDVGKPIREARAEVGYAIDVARAAIGAAAAEPLEYLGMSWRVHQRPHGVVAIVTPWNNPLAIPLGKIVPALLYGNTVVWKPAPAGSFVAQRLVELMNGRGLYRRPGQFGLRRPLDSRGIDGRSERCRRCDHWIVGRRLQCPGNLCPAAHSLAGRTWRQQRRCRLAGL